MSDVDPRSPGERIRQRNTAKVQVGVGIAAIAVAMLLAALVLLGRVTPTGWTGAVSPVVLIVLGIWMLRKGARGLRTRP